MGAGLKGKGEGDHTGHVQERQTDACTSVRLLVLQLPG